ncbi:MAG TPA: hypothetical protein VFE47_20765 [Tepidisphaeraceae bacterium]|nr:hypothetical protein [Tepidisphaeraceae bacterium]
MANKLQAARLRRKLRPLFIIIGAIALLEGINYGWMTWRIHRAKNALSNYIEQHQAMGEPVVMADFQGHSLPADQNAATYLSQAAGRLTFANDAERDALSEAVNCSQPFSDNVLKTLRSITANNGPAIELVHRAHAYPNADWHITLKTPVMQTLQLPHINHQYELGQVIKAAAMYKHHVGDDSGAFECVVGLLTISRALDQEGPFSSHLVAGGIRRMACRFCLDAAKDLVVSGASAGGDAGEKKAVKRSAIQLLIVLLLDDESPNRGINAAWQFERMELHDSLVNSAADANLYVRANFYTEALFLMKNEDELCRAARAPSWAVASPIAQAAIAPGGSMPKLTEALMPGLRNTIRSDFQDRTVRRVAALALAMRLYAIDHGGAWPVDLLKLVPSYLQNVPIDPFSPNGAPIGYLPGNPPSLYSVGAGGNDKTAISGDAAREVFRLGGERAATTEKSAE